MNATTQAESLTLELEELQQPAQLPAVQQAGALAANSPAAMMLQAMAQGASLDQVEKMMDLQERWERREAEKAFNDALAAFKGEAIEIIKRKRVTFKTEKGGTTDYKHAELSDVIEAAGPALSRHGFSWGWTPEQTPEWIWVTCTLKHKLGHCDVARLGGPPDASGGKNKIQAISSAVTYLERQTFKAVCGLAEKGVDDDGRPPVDAVATSSDADVRTQALAATGEAMAAVGTKALRAWWDSLTEQDRLLIVDQFKNLRATARANDAEVTA